MVEYQPVITGSKATTQRCSLRFPRRFLSVLSLFILAKNRRHFPHSYFHIDGNKHSSLRASSPGALTAGREKEEELATTSLEFEYQCIEKVDEKFWLAEMTLVMMSNDFITLGTCFSMFVYIRATFALLSALRWLAEIWQLSRRGATGNWRWNSYSSDVVASSPSFSRPTARAPRRAFSPAVNVVQSTLSRTDTFGMASCVRLRETCLYYWDSTTTEPLYNGHLRAEESGRCREV